MSTVFLNGAFIPKAEATISVDDRGFLLGDGLYEVTPFYEGVPFGAEARHLARLRKGTGVDADRLRRRRRSSRDASRRSLPRTGLEDSRSFPRLHADHPRWVAPRTHYFPEGDVTPTIYAYAQEWSRPADDVWNHRLSCGYRDRSALESCRREDHLPSPERDGVPGRSRRGSWTMRSSSGTVWRSKALTRTSGACHRRCTAVTLSGDHPHSRRALRARCGPGGSPNVLSAFPSRSVRFRWKSWRTADELFFSRHDRRGSGRSWRSMVDRWAMDGSVP